MDRLFDKKFKKSLKSSLEIPTKIAVGALGIREDPGIGSKGEQDRSHHVPGADRPDSTVTLDEGDIRPSGIASHDRGSEDQGLPAPETSATGAAAVDGNQDGNGPTGEYF